MSVVPRCQGLSCAHGGLHPAGPLRRTVASLAQAEAPDVRPDHHQAANGARRLTEEAAWGHGGPLAASAGDTTSTVNVLTISPTLGKQTCKIPGGVSNACSRQGQFLTLDLRQIAKQRPATNSGSQALSGENLRLGRERRNHCRSPSTIISEKQDVLRYVTSQAARDITVLHSETGSIVAV